MSENLSVIGLGYLGVTHSAVLASLGHRVFGIDLAEERVESLKRGELPFFEEGLQELLDDGLKSGRLSFNHEFSSELESVDGHFICVGTPLEESSGKIDVSQVFEAAKSLAPFLKRGASLIGRSTVAVGTADDLKSFLVANAHKDIDVMWNPEFTSEGTAVRDSLHPDRIVLGLSSGASDAFVRKIYEPILDKGSPLIVTDLRTAELSKVAANAFLATKISFINGFASIAEETGASTRGLAEILGSDPRIGPSFLGNGVGFGGGCLPKDLLGVLAFTETEATKSFGNMIRAVAEINTDRLQKILAVAEGHLGDLAGKNAVVLGAAFKASTDDIRESPGIALSRMLVNRGARVVIHDPVAKPHLSDISYISGTSDEELLAVLAHAELVVVATGWDYYRSLAAERIPQKNGSRVVIDGRGVLELEEWSGQGWRTFALGEGG